MRQLKRSLRLAWPAVLALAGCAPLAPLPAAHAPAGDYVCADGSGFRLETVAGATAIEISGMRFLLREQGAAGGGTEYACDMLRLAESRGLMRVDIDGATYLDQCRAVR